MQRDLQDPASPLAGRDRQELIAALEPRRGPERMLDWMLRAAPTATASAPTPTASRSRTLEAAPHGIDFGPLEPRIPEVLRTASGKIELAPEPIVADVDRLRRRLRRTATAGWC